MTTDDTVETLKQKLTSEKPVLAAEASEPLTIVETEESDPKSETKSELRVTATTDLQAAQKADKDVEKVPASNLRRKLNAISILVVHDLLLIGVAGYYFDGFSWLIGTNTGFLQVIGAFQLLIVSWLMLPSTTWRVRGVALYLSIGIIWLGVIGFMLVMYGIAHLDLLPPQWR